VNYSLGIRRASPDDYPGIVALLNCCFADEGPAIGGTRDTLESVADLQASGYELLVLEKDTELVGFVEVNTDLKAAFKLAVLPAWRKHGIGRSLMECGFHADRPLFPAHVGPAVHGMPGRVDRTDVLSLSS
jgi:N-acetylglutamate synthase-like GNAT family acetyltransferase